MHVFGLVIAGLLCMGGSKAPLQDQPQNAVAQPAASTESITVLKLDPKAPASDDVDPSQPLLGGYPILGRVEVDDPAVIEEIVTRLQAGFDASDITPARCFLPRHGVIHTRAQGTTEYVLCFQCHLYRSSGVDATGGGVMSSAAKGVLDRVLNEAGIVADDGLASHTEAVRIVMEVERSGQDLATTTADLLYQKTDGLLGRIETRHGRMAVKRDPSEPGSSTLAIQFDDRIVNGRRKQGLTHIVFDGRWLHEIDHATHQIIERELVPEGATSDPFRLDGPIPLPIGQWFRDVHKRFKVSAIPLSGERILSPTESIEGVVGIRLIPRKTLNRHEQYTSIDLFYDPSNWLPVGVVADASNGDRKVLLLTNVTRNEPLGDAFAAMLTATPPEGVKWKIDRQPLPAPVGSDPAP